MKFNFRADPEDFLIFVLFAVFLLYIVAIAVANVGTFAADGHFTGLNPFPAFSPKFIWSTIIFYLVALLGLFASVSSMFFDREEGFGLTIDKKSKGYSRWAKTTEIKSELTRVPITAKNCKAAGVPLILNKEEMWVDNSEYHSLVIGATGSGKTQTVVLPLVYSLAKAKESMIITDPKGEIYEKTSNMLRSRGYQILLLNFRDPQNGNAWNPMSLPYQMYKSGNQDKAIELLDDLALNILYDDSNKNADPFWEKTSADYFSGVALGLFEDAKEDEININSISLATTVGEEKFGGSTFIKEYFSFKDPSSAAAINASSTIMAPNETKGSILSVFKQKVKLFASRENLSEMLSHSDIDLESIGEKPTAVFIVIQDEKKTYHSLVTILLKQIYETLIAVAQKHGGKLPVRTNFILDEFANMPPLKDVTTMITAARSRAIRFTMIIQNFAQLDDVYGKEEAETIRGNCGNIIYLITTELKALEEISKMCGEVKSKQEEKTSSTPLVTVSDLQRMQQFEVIILRLRQQPFKTKFTPFFKLNWGKTYPPAKYPVRKKVPVHTFDIKDFVKSKKKQKLIDMLNSGEEKDDVKVGLPGIGGMMPGVPSGLDAPRGRSDFDDMPPIPAFLTRKESSTKSVDEKTDLPFSGIPDFETFKKAFEHEDSNSNTVSSPNVKPTPVVADVKPSSLPVLGSDKKNMEDDNAFDVDLDELVKKIDAKIAELEEKEREEQEQNNISEVENNKGDIDNNSIEEVLVEEKQPEIKPAVVEKQPEVKENVTEKPIIKLDEDDDDDDDEFFDDFFDN